MQSKALIIYNVNLYDFDSKHITLNTETIRNSSQWRTCNTFIHSNRAPTYYLHHRLDRISMIICSLFYNIYTLKLHIFRLSQIAVGANPPLTNIIPKTYTGIWIKQRTSWSRSFIGSFFALKMLVYLQSNTICSRNIIAIALF